MGETFAIIVGWMMGLVLVYLLLTKSGGGVGAAGIIKTSGQGASTILSVLQGNG